MVEQALKMADAAKTKDPEYKILFWFPERQNRTKYPWFADFMNRKDGRWRILC
jgi:hypothetical protein